MEIDEIKLYLKIDGNDEDSLVSGLQKAAEEYMANAGVNKDYTKELYKLAIKLLISHWYENRGAVATSGVSKALEFSLNSMIIQLSYTQ